MIPIALGFRASRGGSVVVGIALEDRAPRLMLSTFRATGAEGDRLSLEPYHVAAAMKRTAKGHATARAKAAIAEGRKRQDELAAKGLNDILQQLKKAGAKPATAALLINRAGWMTDLLEYSLLAPEHPAVAEGLAVREALRFALRQCRITCLEMDEKALPENASAKLGLSPAKLESQLKELGAAAGRPWRKEQKLACLAAWIALLRRPLGEM